MKRVLPKRNGQPSHVQRHAKTHLYKQFPGDPQAEVSGKKGT